MTPTEGLLFGMVCIVFMLALHALGQIARLRRNQERDSSYHEWWMRSMESRKADRGEADEPAWDDEDYS